MERWKRAKALGLNPPVEARRFRFASFQSVGLRRLCRYSISFPRRKVTRTRNTYRMCSTESTNFAKPTIPQCFSLPSLHKVCCSPACDVVCCTLAESSVILFQLVPLDSRSSSSLLTLIVVRHGMIYPVCPPPGPWRIGTTDHDQFAATPPVPHDPRRAAPSKTRIKWTDWPQISQNAQRHGVRELDEQLRYSVPLPERGRQSPTIPDIPCLDN